MKYRELHDACKCKDSNLVIYDVQQLKQDSYTFLSDIDHSMIWIDHFIINESLLSFKNYCNIDYNCLLSDHFPVKISVKCALSKTKTKADDNKRTAMNWKGDGMVKKYKQILNGYISDIYDNRDNYCCATTCNKQSHVAQIDTLYNMLVNAMQIADEKACMKKKKRRNKYRPMVGWNEKVKTEYVEYREMQNLWKNNNRPSMGPLHDKFKSSKKQFKRSMKQYKNNADMHKANALANDLTNKKCTSFWDKIRQIGKVDNMNVNLIDDECGDLQIANHWAKIYETDFKVSKALEAQKHWLNECGGNRKEMTLDNTDVVCALQKVGNNKSSGNDHLKAEHIKNASPLIITLLTLLFNLCIAHSFFPMSMLSVVVVPIYKKKVVRQ